MSDEELEKEANAHNMMCLNKRIDPACGRWGVSNGESYIAGAKAERKKIYKELIEPGVFPITLQAARAVCKVGEE